MNFVHDMVFHTVPISTCNKHNDWVENILNDDEFFWRYHWYNKRRYWAVFKKRECLKSAISKGKAYLSAGKWTQEKIDKAGDETINKTAWTERKGEKTAKALGKHVINLYSTSISRLLKIKNVKKLRQHMKDDPIIKDQMARLGCLFCVYVW